MSQDNGLLLDSKVIQLDGVESPLTYKVALLSLLGGAMAKDGEEAVKRTDLGMKLFKMKDLSGLDVDERALLLKVARDNEGMEGKMYVATVQGQLVKALR